MRWLERAGRLNRVIEFLPTDDEVAERQAASSASRRRNARCCSRTARCGCTTRCSNPTCPRIRWWPRCSSTTFPKPLQQRFSEPMRRHPLRREILATHLTNALVNRVGCAFVHRLMEETDAKPGDIVRACIMARDVFDLDAVWRDIDALDNRVADDVQARMFVDVARLLERAALWFLRHLQSGAVADGGVTELIARAATRRSGLHRNCRRCCRPPISRRCPNGSACWLKPVSTARSRCASRAATSRPRCSTSPKWPRPATAASNSSRGLFRSARCLTTAGSASARRRCRRRRTGTCWRAAALAEVARLKRTLASSALAESPDSTTPETIVGAWRARREAALRYEHLLADLRASGGASLAVLLVVVREMAVLERA